MALTSLDIRKTEFTRRLRGLDPEEVSTYLELLSREFESIQHEAQVREDRVRELENRIQHYERIELALEEALRTTRESSRQTMEAAHERADQIKAEAGREAERIKAQAEQDHTRLRQEAQAIGVRRREIVARLRAFLMSEMEVLAHFEGEDPTGFIKLMPHSETLLEEWEKRTGQRVEPPATSPPTTALPEIADPIAGATVPEADKQGWKAADEAPAADYPTPVPEPVAETATPADDAPPTDEGTFTDEASSNDDVPPTDDAASAAFPVTGESGYASEVDAYFQSLQAQETGTIGTPDLTWTHEVETAEAESQVIWPEMANEDWTADVPAHAPEPGETPVPEAIPEAVAPEVLTPDPGGPETFVDRFDAEAWPAFDPVEGAQDESEGDWNASPQAVPDHAEASAPDAAPEPPSADAEPAPAMAGASAYQTRSIHRDRYRIETYVGPTALSPEAAEADMTEESEHIRRLLDRLD